MATQSTAAMVTAANGGVVTLGDGTQLIVPAGAVESDAMITITKMLTGYPETGIPTDAQATTIVREITISGAPPKFKVPITLKMPYALADVPPGETEYDRVPDRYISEQASRVVHDGLYLDRIVGSDHGLVLADPPRG